MDKFIETTRQKVERLIPEKIRKFIDSNNLMIIDKDDFQVCMTEYNRVTGNEKAQRLQIMQLQKEVRDLKQQIADSRQSRFI